MYKNGYLQSCGYLESFSNRVSSTYEQKPNESLMMGFLACFMPLVSSYTPRNIRKPNAFRGYRKRPVVGNGLNRLILR